MIPLKFNRSGYKSIPTECDDHAETCKKRLELMERIQSEKKKLYIKHMKEMAKLSMNQISETTDLTLKHCDEMAQLR
jgi:hypothetical protein